MRARSSSLRAEAIARAYLVANQDQHGFTGKQLRLLLRDRFTGSERVGEVLRGERREVSARPILGMKAMEFHSSRTASPPPPRRGTRSTNPGGG